MSASSRANLVRPASRRRSFARLALSGPAGSGKTWSALSIAEELAEGGSILVIDTEVESAETYADRFKFEHLVWDPPFDPRDLTATIAEVGKGDHAVLIIDSASHFWRGSGGTLDIADGTFGKWKTATPAQDDFVMAVLRTKCHVILCIRSKMAYEVETGDNGKQKVTKLGLAPIQRDDLEYELQVVGNVSMEHRIDIGKTRCPDLSGSSFHPNHEKELGRIYGAWLKGGEPLARQVDVDELIARFNAIVDEQTRKETKREFANTFGKPDQIRESRLEEARSWVAERVPGHGPASPGVPAEVSSEALNETPAATSAAEREPPRAPRAGAPARGKLTEAQRLVMLFTEKLPDYDADARHDVYTAVAGRRITSGNELNVAECAKVREAVPGLASGALQMFYEELPDKDGHPVPVLQAREAGAA